MKLFSILFIGILAFVNACNSNIAVKPYQQIVEVNHGDKKVRVYISYEMTYQIPDRKLKKVIVNHLLRDESLEALAKSIRISKLIEDKFGVIPSSVLISFHSL